MDPNYETELETASDYRDFLIDDGYMKEPNINFQEFKSCKKALTELKEGDWIILPGARDMLWDWNLVTDTAYISSSREDGIQNRSVYSYYENWTNRIHPGDIKRVKQDLDTHIKNRTPYFICEYRFRCTHRRYIWILSKGRAKWNHQGNAVRMTGFHTDITEQRGNEEKLQYFKTYDPLTDTLLSTAWLKAIKEIISRTKNRKQRFAFVYLELGNLKDIYNIYSYSVADRLLKKIVERIKSSIKKPYLLSRIKETDFGIFLFGVESRIEVDESVKRIVALFENISHIHGYKLYITASIGVSIYPDNGRNIKSLFQKSVTAMLKKRESGTGGIQYYTNDMTKEAKLSWIIKKDLISALEDENLFLCYQPQIDIRTQKIVSVEALLRWHHPKMGGISPAQFIPIAEETGLIVPIGEWVIRNACMQLLKWHRMGFTECSMSVNASVVQLQQPVFAERVHQILQSTGLQPQYLEVEITESIFIKSIDTVANNLERLKEQGVKIAIDDFGINYCSLKYLHDFSINNLKIDKTFVLNIRADVNKAIIDSVIFMAHRIGIEVIAEGVETREQYDYLKKMGCDRVQGFYFYRPLLAEKATEILMRNR